MKAKKINNKVPTFIVETSPATQKKVSAVAVMIRDKRLFQSKVEAARKTLTGLKSLPI